MNATNPVPKLNLFDIPKFYQLVKHRIEEEFESPSGTAFDDNEPLAYPLWVVYSSLCKLWEKPHPVLSYLGKKKVTDHLTLGDYSLFVHDLYTQDVMNRVEQLCAQAQEQYNNQQHEKETTTDQ